MDHDTWEQAAKQGIYRTLALYRGLLARGETLDQDQREGLIDLLDALEEFISTTKITPTVVESTEG